MIFGEAWKKAVQKGAFEMGMSFPDNALELMAVHAKELSEWNRRINLTTITDPMEMAEKHYLDSLAAMPLLREIFKSENCRGVSLLDVGSGGGFPGIPLKISLSGLSVTMVDKVAKKVSFLKHAVRIMGLENTSASHSRIEIGEGGDFTGSFDVVACRAFSDIWDFAARALPCLKDGGRLIAYKGKLVDVEIDRFEKSLEKTPLNVVIEKTTYHTLPFTQSKRAIVVLKKDTQ